VCSRLCVGGERRSSSPRENLVPRTSTITCCSLFFGRSLALVLDSMSLSLSSPPRVLSLVCWTTFVSNRLLCYPCSFSAIPSALLIFKWLSSASSPNSTSHFLTRYVLRSFRDIFVCVCACVCACCVSAVCVLCEQTPSFTTTGTPVSTGSLSGIVASTYCKGQVEPTVVPVN
jgi:hypothetical protein